MGFLVPTPVRVWHWPHTINRSSGSVSLAGLIILFLLGVLICALAGPWHLSQLFLRSATNNSLTHIPENSDVNSACLNMEIQTMLGYAPFQANTDSGNSK
jgi:hypothetical protein